MGVDDLTEEVGAGRSRPILRFWEWEASAVVLGSFMAFLALVAAAEERFVDMWWWLAVAMLIDGIDVSKIGLEDLRRNVAILRAHFERKGL